VVLADGRGLIEQVPALFVGRGDCLVLRVK